VVGINKYQGTSRYLKWARSDAEAIATHLRDDIGVPVANIHFLSDPIDAPAAGGATSGSSKFPPDGIASRVGILEALRDIADRVDSNATLIFYFSGHGYAATGSRYPDKQYILAYDSRTKDDFSMISIPQIERELASAKTARRIVIEDSCYSGPTSAVYDDPDAKALVDAKSTGSKAGDMDIINQLQGAFTVSSSSGTELSYEFDDLGHGIFTKYLLDAAKKANSALPSHIVTLRMAFDYAHDQVVKEVPVRRTGAVQTPFISSQVGDVDAFPWGHNP